VLNTRVSQFTAFVSCSSNNVFYLSPPPVTLYGSVQNFFHPSLKNINIKIYEIITLQRKHRLNGVESRILRKLFGPKKEERTGGRRKVLVLFG
jgi:hypothetical protein